jgi:hypothetical protein
VRGGGGGGPAIVAFPVPKDAAGVSPCPLTVCRRSALFGGRAIVGLIGTTEVGWGAVASGADWEMLGIWRMLPATRLEDGVKLLTRARYGRGTSVASAMPASHNATWLDYDCSLLFDEREA